MPDYVASESGEPARQIPPKLESLLDLQFLANDHQGLAVTLSRTRRIPGLNGEQGGRQFADLWVTDRYRLALADGDTAATKEALDEIGGLIAG